MQACAAAQQGESAGGGEALKVRERRLTSVLFSCVSGSSRSSQDPQISRRSSRASSFLRTFFHRHLIYSLLRLVADSNGHCSVTFGSEMPSRTWHSSTKASISGRHGVALCFEGRVECMHREEVKCNPLAPLGRTRMDRRSWQRERRGATCASPAQSTSNR